MESSNVSLGCIYTNGARVLPIAARAREGAGRVSFGVLSDYMRFASAIALRRTRTPVGAGFSELGVRPKTTRDQTT